MEIEKTMLTYDDIWNSNVKIQKKLKITFGAQPLRFLSSFIIWNIPNIILISQISDSLQYLCILTCSAIMSNIFLFIVLFSNPGIIPKNVLQKRLFFQIIGFEIQKELFQVPQITKYSSNKNLDKFMINNENYMLPLKYCAFCHIFRPPRSHHCYTCGNCVLQFDHHCNWIGQCVGQNNYKKFIILLIFCQINLICLFVICGLTINDNLILKIIIIIFAMPTFIFIFGLLTYHFYLIITKQTTKEFVNRTWQTRAGNPFKSSFCLQHPEFIDFNKQYYRNKLITQQFTQIDLSIQIDKTTTKQPIQPYKEVELKIQN